MQPNWSLSSTEEVLNHFQVSKTKGLSPQLIADMQKKQGYNEMPTAPSRKLSAIFIQQFLSPLIYLLLIAALISYFLGDHKDALVILAVVILNAVIGAFQEGRAEQSLKSLRHLSKIRARVLRGGDWCEIEAREIVVGDIFSITSGDAIPTDGRLLEAVQLSCSEAALTGESLPLIKNTNPLLKESPITEQSNMIFAGAFVTSGRGVAIATTIGQKNEIGKVSALADQAQQPKTQLEKKIQSFGHLIIYISIALFALVIGIGLIDGIALKEIFLVAVSQMVSLVPEGLPVAMTIALAVGVQRMAKEKTVVRKLAAVESLGTTTFICSDKTGTLTKNEMTVQKIFLNQSQEAFIVEGVGYNTHGAIKQISTNRNWSTSQIQENSEFQSLLEAVANCNDSEIKNLDAHNFQILGDPTEAALLILCEKTGQSVAKMRAHHPRWAEIPFDSKNKMMATYHKNTAESLIFIKGAPEAVLELSHEEVTHLKSVSQEMAKNALRVLAVGMVNNETHFYTSFDELKGKVKILGLIGQIDPPREEVFEAVKSCRLAGIRPVMITGDHKSTALAIGKKLGFVEKSNQALEGSEIENLSPQQLKELLPSIGVFARVLPEQKLKIVKALQEQGEVVAMTGDGVNDAPALVQADVGVAMGITGTEVAKEASKIIITDDNFSTIVKAVAEGRLVYQNIKKLILFLFVTSIDEVIILLLALVCGYPPPLAAVQILWLNLVSEGVLTVNLIMEPPEGDEMSRPPISNQEPLIDKKMIIRMPSMILTSVAITFGWFLYRTHAGVAPALVQTETFTLLVATQWFNVLNCRSSKKSALNFDLLKNPWLLAGLILANVLHMLVIYWPPLSHFFHTVPIAAEQFIAIGLLASSVLWVEEIRKFIIRKKTARNEDLHGAY